MFLELLTLRIRQILNLVREVRQAITSCVNNEPIAVPPSHIAIARIVCKKEQNTLQNDFVAEMLLKTEVYKTENNFN